MALQNKTKWLNKKRINRLLFRFQLSFQICEIHFSHEKTPKILLALLFLIRKLIIFICKGKKS